MKVHHAAFLANTTLPIAAIGTTILAATTTSKVALVAYTILSVGLAAGSIAAFTAWLAIKEGDTLENYFSNMKNHGAHAFAAITQLVAQISFQAIMNAFSKALETAATRAFDNCLENRASRA